VIHDPDVLPGEAPGGTFSFEASSGAAGEKPQAEPRAPAIDSAPRPPVTLGPFSVEYLGKRLANRVLRIRVGRHAFDLFASLDGIAADVSAELDGVKLRRRPKLRPWRKWSDKILVQRWVIAAAAEIDEDGNPRWSVSQIARNLKRSNHGRRDQIKMSSDAVRNLIQRLAPELAKRRTRYWVNGRKRATPKKKSALTRAAQRQVVLAEMRRAGLL